MVWKALQEAINRVEGMASKWSWNFPHMMVLMKVFVDQGMMEIAMDPVDTHISEEEK